MTDLMQVRAQLRDYIKPLRRVLEYIKVEEAVRGVNVSEYKVLVDARIGPADDYPVGQYEDRDHTNSIYGEGDSREAAIADLYKNIDAASVRWAEVIRIDDGFKISVGREVHVRKTGIQYNRKQVPGSTAATYTHVEPGLKGTVIEHNRAWVFIDFGSKHPRVPVPTWMFHTGYSHYVDPQGNNTGTVWKPGYSSVDVHDPYLEFVDGYEPWKKP